MNHILFFRFVAASSLYERQKVIVLKNFHLCSIRISVFFVSNAVYNACSVLKEDV